MEIFNFEQKKRGEDGLSASEDIVYRRREGLAELQEHERGVGAPLVVLLTSVALYAAGSAPSGLEGEAVSMTQEVSQGVGIVGGGVSGAIFVWYLFRGLHLSEKADLS